MVEKGDSIFLHASCSDILLSMRVEGVRRDRSDLKMEEGIDVGSESETAVYFNGSGQEERGVFFVERGDLSRLNDSCYIEAYRRAISQSIAAVHTESSNSSCTSESELELNASLSQMDLGASQNGHDQQLQMNSVEPVARSSEHGLIPGMEVGMESDSESSTSTGEDYADCIVLDMAHGMSIFGLLAAKEGMY